MKIESAPETIPALEGKLDADGKRFAVVVSRFNSFITERLLLSACDGLLRTGAAQKDITRGIGQSAQETGVPHAFGVLTCDTLEQAIDRAGLKMGNKGFEAALAAVEMVSLKNAVSAKPPGVSKKRSPPSRSASRRNDKSGKKNSSRKRG